MPGAQLNRTPPASSAVKPAGGSPCCLSPHGSSVGNPAVIVSRCLIVTRSASGVTGGQPASSGTYFSAASSSASRPSSRSSMIADAVKLFDIEAIRNTVSASGGGPPEKRAPNPAECTRTPPETTP